MDVQTGAQVPTDTTTATTAPATETPEPKLQELDPQAQHEQLDAMLQNPEWTPEEKADPAETKTETKPEAEAQTETPPGGEQSQETAQEATQTATTQTDPPAPKTDEPEETPAAEDDPRRRFRFAEASDRKFAALRKEGVDPAEAARIAYGLGSQQQQQASETTEATPDPLDAMQTELATVDGAIKKATEEGSGLMDAEMLALLSKRQDLVADIKTETKLRERDERTAHAQAADTEAKARSAQQQAAAEAQQRFPMLASKESALRQETDRLLTLYRGSEFMRTPDAPITLAEQAAANVARAQAKTNGTTFEAELAKLDTTAKPVVQEQKPAVVPATPTPKKITPASGAKVTVTPDKPATDADRLKEINAITDPRAQQAAYEQYLYGT